MYSILSKKTMNYLFIINQLYREETNIELFMASMQCTRLTIQSNVETLNQIIYPSIIQQYQENYSLTIPYNDSYDHCIAKILTDSFELTLLEAIFFEEEHSYLTLSEKLYTSESTIRRTIGTLNDHLKPFDVQIITRPLRIIGNERLIRIIFFRLFIEKYGVYAIPFEPSSIDFIKQFYHLKIPFINRGKNNQAERNFVLFSLVGLQREKNNHSVPIKGKNTVAKFIANWLDKVPFIGIGKLIKNQPKDTITFLSNVFYLYLTDDFFAINGELTSDSKKKRLAKVEEFVQHVLKETHLQIPHKIKSYIVRDVYDANYGFLAIQGNWVELALHNNEYDNFYIFNQALLDKEIVKKNLALFLGEEQLQYLSTTYFLIQTRIFHFLSEQHKALKIGLFIDFDKEFNDYLFSELTSILPSKFELINLSTKKEMPINESIKTVDLLVTNVFTSLSLSENYIYRVSRFFTEEELLNIATWASECYKEKDESLN